MKDESRNTNGRARKGPTDEWVPAHRRLMKGPKRGLPRGVRFVLLELSMEARSKGGVLDLSLAWDTERAVHDLIGGNRREIKQALKAFTTIDEDGLPPIEIVRDANKHRLIIKKWERWAFGKTSTGRVQELRERQRGSQADDLVYFVRRSKDGLIKIGHSDNVARRLTDLQSELQDKITLLATSSGGAAFEKSLHDRFARFRIIGEWFLPDESILNCIAELSQSRNVTRADQETLQRREEKSTGEKSREDPPLAPHGGGEERAPTEVPPPESIDRDEPSESTFDVAWRMWRDFYAQSRRRYGRYVEALIDDDRVIQRLGRKADEMTGGDRAKTTQWLRHWFVSYLRDDGDLDCHVRARHALRLIERRLPTYGEPKPLASVTRMKTLPVDDEPKLSDKELREAAERARGLAKQLAEKKRLGQ